MPPREIFTQATSPSGSSPNNSNTSNFPGSMPPYGQPPQFYQQQYQQPQSYPSANPLPYAAHQLPSPGQAPPPFGSQQPYAPSPPTNTPGVNPYAPQPPPHQQPFYPQGDVKSPQGPSPPSPSPQGVYPGSAPPQVPAYSPPGGANQHQIQDPNFSYPQDLKGVPPPAINAPSPLQTTSAQQPPSQSPFPAVRDPYASHDRGFTTAPPNSNNNNNMAYTQQPGAGPVMVVDARNAKNLPRDAAGEREWSNGICSCMDDCGTCCLAWFCPCMVYSQVKTRLSHLEQQGRPHPEGGETCASDCCIYGLLAFCGFGWVLQIGSRGSIRDRYRISGNGCTDCLAAWCCTPCDLTQESMEIQLEEHALTGHVPKA